MEQPRHRQCLFLPSLALSLLSPLPLRPPRPALRVQSLRVQNVEIPNSKRIEVSLQYIFGIGEPTAKNIILDTVCVCACVCVCCVHVCAHMCTQRFT